MRQVEGLQVNYSRVPRYGRVQPNLPEAQYRLSLENPVTQQLLDDVWQASEGLILKEYG